MRLSRGGPGLQNNETRVNENPPASDTPNTNDMWRRASVAAKSLPDPPNLHSPTLGPLSRAPLQPAGAGVVRDHSVRPPCRCVSGTRNLGSLVCSNTQSPLGAGPASAHAAR